jgi:hypothetical protein
MCTGGEPTPQSNDEWRVALREHFTFAHALFLSIAEANMYWMYAGYWCVYTAAFILSSDSQISTYIFHQIPLKFPRNFPRCRYNSNTGYIACPEDQTKCAAPSEWYPDLDKPLGRCSLHSARCTCCSHPQHSALHSLHTAYRTPHTARCTLLAALVALIHIIPCVCVSICRRTSWASGFG